MGFDPTPEQVEALRLFETGASLAVEAGAGTGKTSTLLLLAESTDDPGQYIAFNKAIVTEASQKMPRNVRCNTAHSLAYRAVVKGQPYEKRLRNSKRVRSSEIADFLGFRRTIRVGYGPTQKTLNPAFLAGHTMATVRNFCQSADEEITKYHVPYIDGIDFPDEDGNRTWDNNRTVAAAVVPAARDAWKDISKHYGNLPFQHEHYLKLWQLSRPRINAEFILFDEAQDANPVMMAVVAAQDHAQLVWVGDSQQQIYSFTGAINALEKIPADRRAYLTQSFRFGDAVAEVANDLLDRLDADLRLKGFDQIESRVGDIATPNVLLARTNAGAVTELLTLLGEGKRPFLVGGGGEIAAFSRAAHDLQAGRRTWHRDLACFSNWGEVQDYVKNDPSGSELKMLVKLIDEFGTQVILDALDNALPESRADVVISTAHKSKGREWDKVCLLGDFPEPTEAGEVADEELRLLYVAVTRAREALDVSRVGILSGDLVGSEEVLEAEKGS